MQGKHNTMIKRIVDVCMTVLLLCLMAFTNVLLIFGILKVISMLMPQSAFRIAFTNGLMSESMIIWFLFVYLEIGRKYGSKDDR